MKALKHAKSFLFIPANNEKFVSKAHLRGADVIILDLEDSIPVAEKSNARRIINDSLKTLESNGQLAVARVNGDLSNLVKDLESLDLAKVSGIFLPKIESQGMVKAVDQLLSLLELAQGIEIGSTELIGIIESASGVAALDRICSASNRLVALAVGSEDYAADLNCEPCEEALLGLCHEVKIATARTGIAAIGITGSIAEIKDLDKLSSQAKKAKRMGFNGALCIHPVQVAIINSAFNYTDSQIDWASRVVEAMRKSASLNQGVCIVDGKMVDEPVLLRAQTILDSM